MSWRQGPQDFSRLRTLGDLTARLVRLTAFEKIQRGEAQLHAYGIPADMVSVYKKHALDVRHTLIPQKPEVLEDVVRIANTKRSTF